MAQARRTGRLPDRVANAPELDRGLALYWVAYCDLSTCRPSSMGGVLPIPWTAIDQYAQRYDYDLEQEERLHMFIGKMDRTMEAWHEKKHGGKQKPVGVQKKDGSTRGWS